MTKRHRADLRVLAEGGNTWARQTLVEELRARAARRREARRMAVELLGALGLVVIGWALAVLALGVHP